MSDVLWHRLRYFITPQFDLYQSIAPRMFGNVLEVGFGTGMGTLLLAQHAVSVLAIEVNAEAVDFAREALPLRNVHWSVHDGRLHIADGLYDVAVMVEVLEHIVDYGLALHSVSQAVKKGGKLYATARNANADLRRKKQHVRERTAEEFRVDLEQYFSEVRLFDYTLQHEQDDRTHLTPLIAVATK